MSRPITSVKLSVGEYLNRSPVTSTRNRSAFAYMARVWDGFSRLLLIAAAVELVTIPWTQYVWTWDQFLLDGQNFESSVLACVVFTCVLLLLTQQSRHRLSQSVTIRRLFFFISTDRELAGMIWDRKSSILRIEQLRNSVFSLDCLPFFRSEIQVCPAAHMGRTDMAIHGFLSKEATTLRYFFEGK
jgi:hypothetical protein